ncbi:MAG: DUF951 domain-containing protein [Clostridia bacterium]|nr:DUF951 domain-containing protein [Clostridia bacterium]
MVEEIRLGDVVLTRKQHPCGSSEWTVIRTGADIKMRCSGCGRVVMLDRETFLKRRKKLLTRGPEPEITPELQRRLDESRAEMTGND